jgi:hypothetical protein
MEQAELEQIIEKARLDRLTRLELHDLQINNLPDSIGSLSSLKELYLSDNQISRLPDSLCNLSVLRILQLSNNRIDSLPNNIGNLSELKELSIYNNRLNCLPDSLGNLHKLEDLNLTSNNLTSLPISIGNLSKIKNLYISDNQLQILPDSIGNLSKLRKLWLNKNNLIKLPDSIGNLNWLFNIELGDNQITTLPESIANLTRLMSVDLSDNLITDFSIFKSMKNIKYVGLSQANISINDRYLTKVSNWKPEWLLDEQNVEIRRVLIGQLGYEKVCQKVQGIEIDNWREYTLVKIDNTEIIYDKYGDFRRNEQGDPVDIEPMVLLKMTCPSTQHIHILRVPPEMKSAEAAITWVNHGIHPDEFAVQT